jgi:hypothetical protein
MANAAIIHDKYSVIQKLQKRGFSHEHAEGIAEALASVDFSDLATKNDLKDLELRLYKYFGAILIAHAVGTAALVVALIEVLK